VSWVLHVDLDEFLVAVERRRRPELVGLPVVVGGRGDPTERGVAATASYEARAYGVSSGTPLRTAARRLPGTAVFLPVDKPAYDEASADVMAVLGSFPVVVEVLGWDEAFLGPRSEPPGAEVDPDSLAEHVRARVREETGLTCSVGIGDNKLQAKLATGLGKPDGIGRLRSVEWEAVMGPQPVDALWGIGARTRARLESLGVCTVDELAATPAARLADEFGPRTGPWLRRIGRGVASAHVDQSPWVPRGHGREVTLQHDTDDWEDVTRHVRALATQVADDIGRDGRPAVRVGVKVRYTPFATRRRSLTLPAASADPGQITAAALALLERFDHTRSVRLVGVRAEMAPPDDPPEAPAGSAR
jgi:DNA polymerase IV